MKEICFTIPLPPVTKKNSQRIVNTGKFYKILPSKQFEAYQEKVGWLIPHKNLRIDYPVNIKAVYYMPTARKVDITNLHSALHDILVHYGVLADDSSLSPQIVEGTDGSRVKVDCLNPRTEITISNEVNV